MVLRATFIIVCNVVLRLTLICDLSLCNKHLNDLTRAAGLRRRKNRKKYQRGEGFHVFESERASMINTQQRFMLAPSEKRRR